MSEHWYFGISSALWQKKCALTYYILIQLVSWLLFMVLINGSACIGSIIPYRQCAFAVALLLLDVLCGNIDVRGLIQGSDNIVCFHLQAGRGGLWKGIPGCMANYTRWPWKIIMSSSWVIRYTPHQKKVTFSPSIFSGYPGLGSVTLGLFQNW